MGAEGASLPVQKRGKPISQAKGRSKQRYGHRFDACLGVNFTGVYAQYSGFLFTYYNRLNLLREGRTKREMFYYVGNVERD